MQRPSIACWRDPSIGASRRRFNEGVVK
jgi:hypothetical protein